MRSKRYSRYSEELIAILYSILLEEPWNIEEIRDELHSAGFAMSRTDTSHLLSFCRSPEFFEKYGWVVSKKGFGNTTHPYRVIENLPGTLPSTPAEISSDRMALTRAARYHWIETRNHVNLIERLIPLTTDPNLVAKMKHELVELKYREYRAEQFYKAVRV